MTPRQEICQESSSVPADGVGQRLKVNSFTGYFKLIAYDALRSQADVFSFIASRRAMRPSNLPPARSRPILHWRGNDTTNSVYFASWPQLRHTSISPPRAAVRQWLTARNALEPLEVEAGMIAFQESVAMCMGVRFRNVDNMRNRNLSSKQYVISKEVDFESHR